MAPATKRKANWSNAQKATKKVAKAANSKATAAIVEEEQDDFIEDDGEDLMAAAMTGKYDDDGSSSDDSGQSDDDSESNSVADDQDEMEEADDDDEEASEQNGKEGEKEGDDAKGGELEGLKETAELYKSNIFKLEIDELLSEIKVNFDKHKTLLNALHQLRSIFENIAEGKEQTLDEVKQQMSKDGIVVPFPNPGPPPGAQYKFQFQKPAAINVVGSYALKTVAKIKGPFNVDLEVAMPTSVFQEKDYVNNRYFYKRVCYLSTLAKAIKDSGKGFNIEFSTFNGDVRRPILVVKPSGDQSSTDFTKAKCIIRILPSVDSTVFGDFRLGPARNNLRSVSQEEDKVAAPTPQYNASLLQDTLFSSHLAFLYQHSKACAGFKDAIILAKAWLFQRGLASDTQQNTGFNAFLFAMIMAYLLQGGLDTGAKKLSAGHSSYQLLRGVMDFLANHDFAAQPIFIGQSEHPEFTKEAFCKNYEVVIVDPSGTVNLASRLTSSGLAQLQHEAKLAMSYFNDSTDRFEAIFLKQVNDPKLRFDNTFIVSTPETPITQYNSANKLDNPNYRAFFAKTLYKILRQGLGNRADLISIQYTFEPSWTLGTEFELQNETKITVGLVLNPDHAPRIVDQGPSSQEKEAAEAFREFWGEKAELRRFKDGSILESVVWEMHGYEARSTIVQKIVQYVLQRHLNVSTSEIQYWGGQLYPFIHYAKTVPKNLFSSELAVSAFQPVMTAYNQFAKHVRSVDSALPLLINNVYPASASLRYATVCLPHPFNFDHIAGYPTTARYMEPMDVIIQIERSPKWPDDLEAMQKVKLAFLLKISEELKKAVGVESVVVDDIREENPLAARGCLDVYYYGFVFRCHIYLEQEAIQLKAIINNKRETDTRKQARAKLALQKHEHFFRHIQKHTFHIQGMAARFPAFSPTVRLVKRWFSTHLLTSHVPEPLVELFCAYVFLEPQPMAPATNALAGFARVLNFLATWDWRRVPLIVDIEGDVTPSVRDKIGEHFTQLRKQNPQMTHGAMFVATANDVEGRRWSDTKPSKAVANRVQLLAKASLKVLDEAFVSGQSKDIKRIFVTPMQDYHAIIQLKTSKCTRYYQSLRPDPQYFSDDNAALGDKPYAGFDPVTEFAQEIEKTYGDLVMVFYDKHGGDQIALVWDPVISGGASFKADAGYNSIPSDMAATGSLKPRKGSEAVSRNAVPNFAAILREIRRLGAGLVQDITTMQK